MRYMVMIKKISILCLSIVFMLALVGCGSQSTPDTNTTETQTEATTTTQEQIEPTNSTLNDKEGAINEEKALEIALNSEGISPNSISYSSVHKEIDNGIEIYDVDFAHKDFEYSFDIDATSGKIIEKDRESVYDD